jgi:antitoxin VapB
MKFYPGGKMVLNIKNPEAHKLAQELAEVTGQTITQAVTEALRDALLKAQQQRRERNETLLARLEAIARHCASLPVRDDRSPDDILGYDEQGLLRWTHDVRSIVHALRLRRGAAAEA